MFGLGLRQKIRSQLRNFFGSDAAESETTSFAPAAPPAADEAAPESDSAGPALSTAAVQAVLDEMVRPALQSDGGDITLVKIENNDIYVRLVGACSSCPSSTITMRMGVERLLTEEFPQMRSLIQVDAGVPA